MGRGGVIRDAAGRWKGGCSAGSREGDALCTELLALEEGLLLCWEEGFRHIVCELDCLGAVQAVRGSWRVQDNLHKHRDIIWRVKDMRTWNWVVEISWVPREYDHQHEDVGDEV
ncbi:uncharacterized protein LOC114916446 [Cajanus cajan]|uniref:uncharacterized protein LOC114916446 n=1 Tax=Cajanus cajan TaxID=3821 RepID=UPI0010FB04AE|nr:uncharacterized protein LOC114916446 [Cajanus cajan]